MDWMHFIIEHVGPWVLGAFAYAIVVLLIARFCGINSRDEDPNTGYPKGYHPNSPGHYYQDMVGTKRTFTDVDMDDPEWAARLEDEL